MGISGIGYTSYVNFTPVVKAYNATAPSVSQGTAGGVINAPEQPSTSPVVFSMKNENGPGVIYQNEDGDRAEISMPGSGLLDELKPEGECQTCANRKYVDGSNDASVSYQTPTKISSNMAGAKVAAHEQEHVRNERANAAKEDREIVSQTVTLEYDTCPECGKVYVAGGTTRTMSVGKKENPMAKQNNNENSNGNVNAKAE